MLQQTTEAARFRSCGASNEIFSTLNMDKPSTEKMTHDEIHALVDGQLPPAQRAAALARAAADPASQETVQAWQEQRAALRELQRPLLDETIPETLLTAARRGAQDAPAANGWWRWGGMAASIMLAFVVGWTAHSQLNNLVAPQTARLENKAGQTFVHQAVMAHAMFSPEVRHPVEVGAAQQEHLVAWLSKRLGKPLKVPVLTDEGFELVGGRLLPGEGGARAQFMFQRADGVRVTLYLGALTAPADSAATNSSRETAFRYSTDGPVPAFYWVDQGFGYAMSGALPRDMLMRLAGLVYRQL
jgi:anti-sigma factor RsiW